MTESITSAPTRVPQPFVKIEQLTIKGISIDPRNIVSLDIYEGINKFGISGRLIMQDWSAVKEYGNIFAGDEIQITFGRQEDPALQLRYVIYSSYGDTFGSDNMSGLITFDFCSAWFLEASTRKRSRPFRNNRIDEIIFQLVEDCGGIPGIFKETKQVLDRFVSPYWTPAITISHLLQLAESTDGLGGYCLWTEIETDRVNLLPIGDLISDNDDEIYGNSALTLRLDYSYEFSPSRILQQKMDRSFNTMQYADVGAARSRFVGFNYDHTEVLNADQKLDAYTLSSRHPQLGAQSGQATFPMNDKYLGLEYRNTQPSHLYYNTDSLIPDFRGETLDRKTYELAAGRLHTKYTNLFSDLIKVKCSTPGENYRKRAGRLIKVEWPSIETRMQGDSAKNEQISGTYLIRNIRHTIDGLTYVNTMTLMATAYNAVDRVDMIDLDGNVETAPTGEAIPTNVDIPIATGNETAAELSALNAIALTQARQQQKLAGLSNNDAASAEGDQFDADISTAVDGTTADKTATPTSLIDNSLPQNQQITPLL